MSHKSKYSDAELGRDSRDVMTDGERREWMLFHHFKNLSMLRLLAMSNQDLLWEGYKAGYKDGKRELP